MRYLALFAGLMLCVGQPAHAAVQAGVGLVGGENVYHIQPGDTLTRIGARFGVSLALLLRENQLDANRPLKIGRELHIDNRHIVPAALDDGIVINIPQRMLFRMEAGVAGQAFPVGLGRPDWPTELGDFTVVSREADKTWFVPPSIQREMARKGEVVKTQVPPGPDNPLGKHWLGLSLPGLGIHGTIAPESIYHFQSHGCIRLHPDDAAVMFDLARVGDSGRLIYQPVLLYRGDDGRVFIESHRDIYRKGVDAMAQLSELAASAGVDAQIDWNRAEEILDAQEGIARDVTRTGKQETP